MLRTMTIHGLKATDIVRREKTLLGVQLCTFRMYVYLLAKCFNLSDLLNNLCHHNAFSLHDVFVDRLDIGKSLWVV